MIQFLADNIDQLDLALDQLAVRDRNFDRFAFMLIDNVVELTLHRFAQDKASENEMWGRLREPKHDQDVIAKALGQNFDNKVRGAFKLDLFSAEMMESILNLHSYRNTAYHKGLRHERILHSLAVFYLRTACELLKKYKPNSWSWSSTDEISYRARKYIGDPRGWNPETLFGAAYARLSDVAEAMYEDLVGDLSADMEATIEQTDNAIKFLAEDGPEKRSRNEIVINCQAWPFAFTDEAKQFARERGYADTNGGSFVDWVARNYPWQVASDPIPGWQIRLQNLRAEENYHKALKRYCDFMRQTDEFRSRIGEAETQLDMHIQNLVDEARGK